MPFPEGEGGAGGSWASPGACAALQVVKVLGPHRSLRKGFAHGTVGAWPLVVQLLGLCLLVLLCHCGYCGWCNSLSPVEGSQEMGGKGSSLAGKLSSCC